MRVVLYFFAFISLTIATPAQADVHKLKESYNIAQSIRATITAYTDSPRENLGRGKPVGTAIGTRIRPGIVAVSRDLLRSGWEFGKSVYIEGMGVFIIEDTMSPRFSRRIDIAVDDMHHAIKIGKRTGNLAILLHPKKDAQPTSMYIRNLSVSRDES